MISSTARRNPGLSLVPLLLLLAVSAPSVVRAAGWPGRPVRTLRLARLKVQATVGGAVGAAIGRLELLGLRFSVKPYQAQVAPRLRRGSRVDRDGMRALAAQGYRTVIALTAERIPGEEEAARELGLRFHRIPIVDNTAPTLAQMKTFLDLATDPRSGRVYVHCEAGKGRTGTAVAAYRMAVEGVSSGKAIAEAHRFGLSLRTQTLFLRRFGASLREGAIPGYPRPRL
jgi:protein tyrosine phosphatase (PTP) superfamily phosphohydrolase (DUF442 family)